MYSVPLTLIILLIAFGAVVAAGIPLLLGLSAVLGTLGLVSIVSNVVPMADTASALVLLIGLAVGVDYSMFYLKREREERAAGRSEGAALEAAAATSGHSVLVSGVTVIVAMSGMLLTRDATFASFGIATMMVVAVAMLGSLTVLPAVLSKLGDRVDRGRVPFIGRLRRTDGEGRIWGAILDRVLRRPVVSVVLAGGLLLAIAAPALQMITVQPGIDTFPQHLLTTYNRLEAAFPGTEISAAVVVKAADVELAGGPGGDPGVDRRRRGHRGDEPAGRRERQPRRHGRRGLHPGRRERQRRTLQRSPGRAPRRHRAGNGGLPGRHRGRGHRDDGPDPGLRRPDEHHGPTGVRVRAAARVPPDAGDVQVARHRHQGGRC